MEIKYKLLFVLPVILILTSFYVACDNRISVVPVTPKPPVQSDNSIADSSETGNNPVITNTDNDGWNTVAAFSGADDETSHDFYISGNEWRLTWEIEPEINRDCAFNILVYQANKSAVPVKIVSGSKDKLSDTVNFQEGIRSYYLKIITANLKNWTIQVEDYSGGENTTPVVQIDEIHYKGTLFEPDPNTCLCFERTEPDEYVVIKNMSTEWVDIRGWKIINVSREGNFQFTFPDYFNCCPDFYKDYFGSDFNCIPPMQCILAPHQSVLVYTDEFHPETGGLSFNYGNGDIWQNDRPNIAVLYDAEGNEVSRKSYLIRPEPELQFPVQITYINYRDNINLPATDNVSAVQVERGEYVEISNLSDSYQGMGGWVLKNTIKEYPVFVFPSYFSLGPGNKVLIYTNQVYTPDDLSFNYSPGDIWNDEVSDTAVLYNTMGEEVSRKSYKIID